MPDCRYCSDTYTEDNDYLEHLADTHIDELSRIDRKRLDNSDIEIGPTTRNMVLQGIIITVGLLLTIGLLYFLISNGLTMY